MKHVTWCGMSLKGRSILEFTWASHDDLVFSSLLHTFASLDESV